LYKTLTEEKRGLLRKLLGVHPFAIPLKKNRSNGWECSFASPLLQIELDENLFLRLFRYPRSKRKQSTNLHFNNAAKETRKLFFLCATMI
jgi:hypothetical protein